MLNKYKTKTEREYLSLQIILTKDFCQGCTRIEDKLNRHLIVPEQKQMPIHVQNDKHNLVDNQSSLILFAFTQMEILQ